MCPCVIKEHQSSRSSTLKISPASQTFLQADRGFFPQRAPFSELSPCIPTAPHPLSRGWLSAQQKLLPPGQQCLNPRRSQCFFTLSLVVKACQWHVLFITGLCLLHYREKAFTSRNFHITTRLNFQSMALTCITVNSKFPSISTGLSQAGWD